MKVAITSSGVVAISDSELAKSRANDIAPFSYLLEFSSFMSSRNLRTEYLGLLILFSSAISRSFIAGSPVLEAASAAAS